MLPAPVPMSNGHSSEETTVFAIYSTRRDAELAREYLQNENIETFVRADDAGGMHPQMQRPHGVKLVGMSSAAQDAYKALNEADLLPDTVEERSEDERFASGDARIDEASSTVSGRGIAVTLGVVAVVLLLLYYLFAA